MTNEEIKNKIKELKHLQNATRREIYKLKKISIKPNPNIIKVTPVYYTKDLDLRVNDIIAARMCNESEIGDIYNPISKISGHGVTIILYSYDDGQWFDEDGNQIDGNLYYKPYEIK